MVDSARVGGFGIVFWAFEDVVPFEDVAFVGLGDDCWVGEGVFVEGFEFSLETFGGEGGCHFEFSVVCC